MLISENDLKHIILESVRRILNERASDVLYHYCTLDSLLLMLENNCLMLSDDEQEYNGDGKYFMSLTRNRNSKQGYPYMQSKYSMGGGTAHNVGSEYFFCRIEFDGHALNTYNNFKVGGQQHNFKVKPFDWLYHESGDMWDEGGYEIVNGKQDAMRSDSEEEIYHQPFSQAEDRLTSDKDFIPNFKKYVKRIDFVFDINDIQKLVDYYREENPKEISMLDMQISDEIDVMEQCLDYCHDVPCHLFINKNDFDKQRNNVGIKTLYRELGKIFE
jgi:hypothetical protein